MKFPIYDLTIKEADTDKTMVNCVAFVDEPAIERNWQFFNAHKDKLGFKASEEKKIVSGYLMVADLPIYRKDAERGEYYVKFSKETISKIVEKFFRNGWNSNVNLMHDEKAKVEGAYMFESLIVDKARGVNPPVGFEDAPDGSWFGSFKVDNDEVWNLIKEGKVKAFSVEGVFEHIAIGEASDKAIDKEKNKINNFLKTIIGEENFKKLTAYFKAKFMDAKLKDGTAIKIVGEGEPAPGMPVVVEVDGAEKPVPDGEHEMADGSMLVVKDGLLVDLKKKAEPETPPPATDYSAKFAEYDQKFTALQTAIDGFKAATDKLNTLENAFNEFKSGFEKNTTSTTDNTNKLAQLKELVGTLFEAVQKMGELPGGEPATRVKKDSFKECSSIEDILAKMKEWRKEMNSN